MYSVPMLSRPLVTVVTPSYNYARYLGACLASVRAQSYPHIQHIIRDACSTDGSAEVVASFQGTYNMIPRFEKDGGAADALNRGFAEAQGDVFCWLNADDYWMHEHVVDQAVASLANGADVVTAGGWLVNVDGTRIQRIPAVQNRVDRELRYSDGILQPATFWRRSFHRPLRADLHYTFDWALWLDMQRAGARFRVRDEDWAAYRWHSINKTATDPANRRAEIALILAESCGSRSPQALWARTVARGYTVAERRRMPRLKRAVAQANRIMCRLTRRRIFSC